MNFIQMAKSRGWKTVIKMYLLIFNEYFYISDI